MSSRSIGSAKRAVVAPAATDYRASDPQIAWHLGKFIAHVRSRSLDAVLMRENWLSAMTSRHRAPRSSSANMLARPTRSPRSAAAPLSVQVTSVVRASDSSFQVKWTEQAYERGSLSGTSRWTAMLTVKVQPPRSAEVLRKNPLGLYVDAIDWSRELETPADRAPPVQAMPMPREILPLGSPVGSVPIASEPLDPLERSQP